MQYPLNDTHSIKESSKSPAFTISVSDPYFDKSMMSLEGHIDDAKRFLQLTYCSAEHHDDTEADEVSEYEQICVFQDKYQNELIELQNGRSASSCQEKINEWVSSAFLSKSLQDSFSIAMTWSLCTDLLHKSGFDRNAWSTLIEYKKFELQTEIALEEEYSFFISTRNKAAGKKKGARYHNLRDDLIEHLVTPDPPSGWIYKKTTASKLAPLIYKRHSKSEHASLYPISQGEVETKLYSWLINDSTCKAVYAAHARKKSSKSSKH
ncbi:hypothetical protein [Vreelandella populi]|uniref:Uncharacterized protein n=1 Tax=Vreelandella populi TaxID=2498858 RepID=A0A433L8D8_9GAMM|nr:hypothetical protein [Halomonas populi]RUR43432.1 hypothetical protein ELY37_17155 [Halomonas populi]